MTSQDEPAMQSRHWYTFLLKMHSRLNSHADDEITRRYRNERVGRGYQMDRVTTFMFQPPLVCHLTEETMVKGTILLFLLDISMSDLNTVIM